jgi:hypothetical protein
MTAVRLPTGTSYDPDDIFGVRKALRILPEPQHDAFFDRWIALTEACNFDVPGILAAVRLQRAVSRPGAPGLDAAWSTVDEAITGYLDWRAAR